MARRGSNSSCLKRSSCWWAQVSGDDTALYVVIVTHYLVTKVVAQMKPLVVTGTSGANTPMLVIAIMSVAGLVLSLVGRRYADHSS